MTSDEAFANLQSVMHDYSSARKSLDLHRGLANRGMANSLMQAVAAEHSAFHRLERAQAAYAALQPVPTPKPAPAKPAAAITAPPVTPRTTASTADSLDLLGHLNDRCEVSENRWRAMYGLKPLPRS